MKVLELCLSDGKGGLELYVYRTSVALGEKGLSCLAVVSADTFLHTKIVQDRLPYELLPRLTHHFPFLSAIRLAKMIDSNNIDILHVHWGKDLFLAALAKRFASKSIKLIYTRQMMITRPKNDFYHRFVYSSVDLYITITDELKLLAQKYLPLDNEKIVRLYYGVKKTKALTNVERNKQRAKWLSCSETEAGKKFLVGIVGRIEEQKGQILLIRAIEKMQPASASITAIIIGPAMDHEYLVSLQSLVTDLGLTKNIYFVGAHPNPIEIMSALDVLVLATRKETFGLVLVEAMRAAVPVIGSNSGGVPEIIEHEKTGLLFEPDDVNDLATQVARLFEDRDFGRRIAEAGRVKADLEFSHEQHYDRLSDILLDISRS